jgi:tetratricopeptide (TPR) repeat protein
MDKIKNENLFVIAWGILLIGIPTYMYISQMSYQLKEGARIAKDAFDPSTEIGRANLDSRLKTQEEFGHWSRGDSYMKSMRFEEAAEEYKLVNKYGRMEWESRTLLAGVYEKADKRKEALEELEWLIAQKPREEVLNGFIARRDAILQKQNSKVRLLAAKENSNKS